MIWFRIYGNCTSYRMLFRLYSGKKTACCVQYLNSGNYVSFSSCDQDQIGIKLGTKHVI